MTGSPVLLPSDKVLAGYNLLMVVVWLPFLAGPSYVGWLIAAHLAAAALPLAIRHGSLTGWMATLREVYPLAWIAAFWSEIDLHSAFIDTTLNDARIAALDRAIFGMHLHQAWVTRMPWTWLNTLMQGSYFAYYFLIVGVPTLVLLQRSRPATRELVLRLTVGYLACFACYATFPVNGPDGTFPVELGSLTHNALYRLNGLLRTGDSLGSSFPSSHVAASLAFAWVAWRLCKPWQAAIATAIAVLIALATVYTANHFAVDSLAGLVLGLGMQSWVTRLERPLALGR